VLRCLIDAMIFDAIAAEPAMLRGVDALTSARRLELLAAAETMREIGATPDRAHRRRLQRVRVLVVPPADRGRAATRELLAHLRRHPGVSDEDARIAVAAGDHGVPLVTEDAALRAAVEALLPQVQRWRWEADLRPRLVALGVEG
jgi:predicted nucleic acid-binding protein